MSALLQMRGIVRRYGEVRANDGVDLDVGAGEILGLLGENGSGKSTLMKVLFGMTAPDAGAIVFDGRELSDHSPAEATAAGITMIHQHFMLIEAMSVAENVMLGWAEAGRVLRRAEVSARVRDTSRKFGMDLDPDSLVADLPLGRKQRVEILKAVLRRTKLLILDEPTSNLAPTEVAELLTLLRRLRAEGVGIVFITHKLPEVLEVCDRVVVLRAGRVAGAARAGDVTRAQLAELMVGRDTTAPHVARAPVGAEPRLAVEALEGAGLGPLSFEVRRGEILGVAGVDGNGQLELVQTLAGLSRVRGGSVRIDGRDVTQTGVAARMRAGLAYMPADRAATALVRDMSIGDNLRLRDSGAPPYVRGGFLSPGGLRRRAAELMSDYDIRAPDPGVRARSLSGGNQQKIVIARELERQPGVLVAHQAAWGLDPGATRFVLERILALRERGAAIVYVSSELDEVLDIADRVAVMANGGFAGLTSRGEADLAQIGLWMSGRAA